MENSSIVIKHLYDRAQLCTCSHMCLLIVRLGGRVQYNIQYICVRLSSSGSRKWCFLTVAGVASSDRCRCISQRTTRYSTLIERAARFNEIESVLV